MRARNGCRRPWWLSLIHILETAFLAKEVALLASDPDEGDVVYCYVPMQDLSLIHIFSSLAAVRFMLFPPYR